MRRPRLPLAGLAGALIAGALLPLAFAPFGVYGLAPLSLAVLFALWYRAANARQGFALGYAFGLGQFGVGVSWLYNSLHLFGETIAPLAALVTLLFVAFVALFPALAGYLALRLAPAGMAERGGRSLLLLFPGVWGLVEWLRGRALGGFPWLDLGASQTDSLLSGYGPVLGEYGMGAAVTLSAGAALWWVMGAARARWLFAPLLLGLIWGGGAWLGGLRWVEADGAPIDVALVQGNVPQMRKFDPDVLDSTLRLYWNLSRQAADARLVLWPETAIPTVLSDVPGFMRVL
ncbi:MAG: apolipoprotein N-acyltransferase, partial [Halothiobacillaceae bacterium]|nr:apolipoprotein N-acyltransferase [Halothiobacillaceae bacterium]